uniref:Globin family profile domain-containing protein n=3 Tax=Wuchereria bancrofti TaxID=6293 RepID=A0A1I8EQL8_WUCBA
MRDIPKIHPTFPLSTSNPGLHFSYTYGNVRPKFVKNLSDLQIQRYHIKYLNDQLSIQPQNSSQNSNNTHKAPISSCIDRLSVERKKLLQLAPHHVIIKKVQQVHYQSINQSINQRASLITDMFADTGYTGNTLADQLQLSRTVISKNTIAKELFRKTSIIDGFTSYKCYDVKEHADSLIELIDFALQEIHSSIKVVQDRCMLMGAAHCNTCENSMSSSWDQFGDSLAESIAKAEAIRGKRKCLKAWNALLSFIVDRIKGGYLAESKRRASKKSSRQENAGPSSLTATASILKYDNAATEQSTTYH